MGNIVPTSYANKATPVDSDSLWGYDSEWVANVNFLFSAIKNYLTSNITTSDIDEWTNLYYTEARVNNNTTVVNLWNNKADKSNVLEKNNTTAFTPTTNYHPATKLYVDSQWININWLTEQSAITSWDELVFYDTSSGANRKVDLEDLSNKVTETSVKILYTSANQTPIIANQLFTFTHNLWLTQADVEANRYEIFLAAIVNGSTELLGKQGSSSSNLWWGNWARVIVNHIWSATDPSVWIDTQVNHQANSLKIRVWSDGADIDSFRLVIHKIY